MTADDRAALLREQNRLLALTEASCAFLGMETGDVLHKPGDFLRAALAAFTSDLEIVHAAAVASHMLPETALESCLFRLHSRLEAIRSSERMLDELLAEQAVIRALDDTQHATAEEAAMLASIVESIRSAGALSEEAFARIQRMFGVKENVGSAPVTNQP